jgi:peptidoglycan glycosyltransferase
VNRQIGHLFVLITLLFAALVAYTSRWTVFEQEELESHAANRRPLLEEMRVPRGRILARDGTVLARSRRRGRGSRLVFTRTYPEGALFAHAVGYSFITQGRTGLERSRNDELSGKEDEFTSIIDELNGSREGDDVRTGLDPAAQRTAIQALQGKGAGAVVAIEPASGRVRVMATVPGYDPNAIPDLLDRLRRNRGRPLFNRATQTGYPPGSTFKVVTATAALDTGRYRPDSIVDGSSPKEISGVPLSNCCAEGTGDYGPIPLTTALTNSVNTAWAGVGEKLGRETLVRYMKRFGLYDDPPLDYPDDQMLPSGVRDDEGGLVEDGFDAGRVAIGQGGAEGQTQVSPLQMAMVAAAVANGGKLMRPRLTDRVIAQDGRIRDRVEPKVESEVMKPQTASTLAGMMAQVVKSGTGRAAAIPGIEVAGKTGTAEVDGGSSNQAWFIAFAPVGRPRVAIAVTVERTQGQGGTVAAPIAKQVMQELLR